MTKNCCVVQCNNNLKKRTAKHFHSFPKNKQLKKEWIRRLKMGRNPTKHQMVCSEHFKKTDYEVPFLGVKERFKKGTVPTERTPKTTLELSGIIKPKKTRERSLRLKTTPNISNTVEVVTSTDHAFCNPVSTANGGNILTANGSDALLPNNNLSPEHYDDFSAGNFDSPDDFRQSIEPNILISSGVDVLSTIGQDNSCIEGDVSESYVSIDSKNKPVTDNKSITVKPDVETKGIQVSLPKKQSSYGSLSDTNLQYFTGLERERFEILWSMLEKFAPIEDSLFWYKKDALVVTLYKIKHNSDFKMMDFTFELSSKYLSQIFKEVIDKLYFVLKQINIWGISHKDTKSYRTILDCTEMFVVEANDPSTHHLTFSSYKDHPTFKLLVGCDEMGAVNFISDAFVGSISDREIKWFSRQSREGGCCSCR